MYGLNKQTAVEFLNSPEAINQGLKILFLILLFMKIVTDETVSTI